MESNRAASSRGVLIALALGTAPAAAAWIWGDGVLQPSDLPVALAALALTGIAFVLPGRAPDATRWPAAAALGVAAVPALLAAFALDGPISNDERAYLLQAETFAEGRLWQPLPEVPAAFHRRQVYEDHERGRRFAKYPPGTAAALVPGVWLGAPWLVPLLAAVLSAALVRDVTRRLGAGGAARDDGGGEAAWVLATSPFFLLVYASFQSEIVTLPAALAGHAALLRARDPARRAWPWALAVGACAGAIFLARPLTGVVFAVACGIALLVHPARLRTLLAAILGGLPFLALLLAYQAALTGDPWTSPYAIYARDFGPFDAARQPVDVYGRGDPLAGLLRQAGRWGVGATALAGSVALGFWGLWRVRRRDGGAGLLFATLLPLAYAWHWYPGHWAYLGPLYCFESLGALTAGTVLLLQGAATRWRHGLILGMVAFGFVAFGVRWESVAAESRLRSAPQRVAAREAPDGAVIVLPRRLDGSPNLALKTWTPSFEAGEGTIVLRLPRGATPRALAQALGLGDRPLYRFVPQGDDGSLQRVAGD